MRSLIVILAAAVLSALAVGPASAHEARKVGALTLEVGWTSEPAYAGFGNEVVVAVEKNGQPVTGGELTVVVIFGDPDGDTRTDPMILAPAFDAPNEYLGYIIPTRPGTYTFRVTGTVGGQAIDETFTSGEQTFENVNNPTEAEFPAQDPTRGELADAIERLRARSEEPASQDSTGLWVAIASGLVALGALVVALRKRPT